MLSRLSLAGGQSIRTCVFRYQVSAITTSAPAYDSAAKTNNPANYPPEYPPPTSKRDFVNYPRPIWKETSPPVRLGFIPESWFKFLYPKTGYTGPYMLGFTVIVYMLSKEKLVIDHNFTHLMACIFLLCVVHIKGMDKISKMLDERCDENIKLLDGGQEEQKNELRDHIKVLEGMTKMSNAVVEVTKGTTEVVLLQLELAYRERLQEAYMKVKNTLDCQAELENIERRIAQKNLMDYVLTKVMSSLTPEFEKKSIEMCIKNLNELAATA